MNIVDEMLIEDIKKLPIPKQIDAVKCLLSNNGWLTYMAWLASKTNPERGNENEKM